MHKRNQKQVNGDYFEKPFFDCLNSTDAKIGILVALQTFGGFSRKKNFFELKEDENRKRKQKEKGKRKQKKKEKRFAFNKNMDRRCETDGCQFQKMSQKEQINLNDEINFSLTAKQFNNFNIG